MIIDVNRGGTESVWPGMRERLTRVNLVALEDPTAGPALLARVRATLPGVPVGRTWTGI